MGSPFNLRNGSMLLSTEAPGGVYNSTQLKKIAALAESNTAVIRATEDQRIALIVAADKVAQIAKELKSTGLGIRHYQDGMHQPVACVGELCPEHQQDALGAAMDITKVLADITSDSPVKIGINGCATCCVPCHTYDVSVIGDTNGYRISLGGKNSQIPEMATFMAEGVPAAKLPGLIRKIVELYKEHAQSGERLQDVMERVGTSSFVAALAPYSQDAAASDPFGAIGSVSLDSGTEAESTTDELSLDDSDLSGLLDEAAEDAAEIVSDAASHEAEALADGDDLMAMSDVQAGGLGDIGDLESMDDLTPSSISAESSGGTVVDDIDPQGFGGGDLSADVLIADDEVEFAEASMTRAEAYDAAATDDDALEMPAEELQDTVMEDLAVEDLAVEDLDAGVLDVENLELDEVEVDSGASDGIDNNDDEDEIERKLTASIEETGATPIEEDENAADREAAASMLDTVSAVSDDELGVEDYSGDALSGMDDGGMEMSDSEVSEGIPGEVPMADDSALDYESIGKDESAAGASHGHGTTSSVHSLPGAVGTAPSGWQISAVEVGMDGKYVLHFNSGAQLKIDPRSFTGSRQFSFAGKAVTVHQTQNGINIAVDGIEVFVPRLAVA